jgi:hypothetical protein
MCLTVYFRAVSLDYFTLADCAVCNEPDRSPAVSLTEARLLA